MNCRNLFNLFDRSGGKLECHYDSKTCSLTQGEKVLNCDLKPSNRFDLETLVVDYSLCQPYNTKEKFQYITGNAADTLHSLHFKGTKGFTIEK